MHDDARPEYRRGQCIQNLLRREGTVYAVMDIEHKLASVEEELARCKVGKI